MTASDGGTYREFNAFCSAHFGAEREPELYRMFGRKLQMTLTGTWRYVSERSAVVAWETNLPAKSFVEFGETARYGRRTAEPERHFFLHLHYLRGLRPGTTYHYRLVSIDERGNTLVSDDFTFTTRNMTDAVRIPGDLPGPPYVLDKPDTTYLVTEDIVADSTALNIAADRITLDLGGHTVVYDQKAGSPDPSASERLYGWFGAQGPCGIRTADGRTGITIVNGIVRQGRGNGASKPAGYNPIFMRRPRQAELAGVTVHYGGSQVTGILINNAYDGLHVHHNVVVDHGTQLYNRHRGLDAIAFLTGNISDPARCHHNLIKRTRHRGITVRPNNDVYANEIYVDSYATNSYGIMYYDSRASSSGLALHDNRIFGTGFHPIGIGSGQGYSDVRVYGNYIQMQAKFERRWTGGAGGGDPAHQRAPANGIRLQRPRHDIVHSDNVVVVKGTGQGSEMRGIWLVPDENSGEGLVFRNNVVKVVAEDELASGYAIACCAGADRPTVVLEANTVISNIQHVQCGDNYGGHSRNFRFFANTFIRTGSDPRYQTIRLGWKGLQYQSFGHLFVDTLFQGGAGYEQVSFDGARRGRYDFSVGWTLTVRTTPGAKVAITDRSGKRVFSQEAGPGGTISARLLEYIRTQERKTLLTPHTVVVERAGRRVTEAVTMDRPRRIEIRLPPR